MSLSAKVATRIASELKRYQGIISNAKQRDIGEADTVTIITDMLSNVFGYDKYQHITSEHGIKGAFADIAVIVDNETRFLIEAKAIGIELKDIHVRQVVDYAANNGTEWVVLTNAAVWRAYKVHFTQPIEKSLIFEIDLMTIKPKSTDVLDCFGTLCCEGFSKDSMSELWQQKQITSKFAIASLLLSESILNELRREIRRLSGVNVELDYLSDLLEEEVIKRELVDSEEAKEATSIIKKMKYSITHFKKKKEDNAESDKSPGPPAGQEPPSETNMQVSTAQAANSSTT